MKLLLLSSMIFAMGVLTGLTASRSSQNYVILGETMSAGEGQASGARYAHTVTVGAIGGSVSASPVYLRALLGYPGQLFEVTGLKLTASPTSGEEGGSSRVEVTAKLDDLTLLRLSGGEVKWRVFLGPVESIDTNGVVKFGNVYQDSVASIEAGFQGQYDRVRFLIRNVGLDDFGLYASDGIPDLWQVEHFGVNNPLGTAIADPDRDGQSNLFEYIAGLSPTNAASRFTLAIADVPGWPDHKALILSPRLDGRSYQIESSTNLTVGFAALTNAEQIDFGSTRFVLDPNAVTPTRFYRVRISSP